MSGGLQELVCRSAVCSTRPDSTPIFVVNVEQLSSGKSAAGWAGSGTGG